jgi:hypothetical protein
MDPDNPGRKIDAWLDQALARYSGAEPRAGIENRVLAALRAEQRNPRRRRWMVWVPAAATAAVVVVAMVAVYSSRKPSPRVLVPSPIESKRTSAGPPETMGERQPGKTAAGAGDAMADSSAPRESRTGVQAPEPETVVSAAAPAGEPASAKARVRVAPGLNAALPAAPLAHSPSVFPVPAPLSEQERLAITAFRCGLLRSAKPQIPPGDELLPQVEIQEIRIEPLKSLEQS